MLEEHEFRELHPDAAHPVRIGLVTNQTGVDAHGQRTADVLAHAPGIKLAAIFSPEHGVAGNSTPPASATRTMPPRARPFTASTATRTPSGAPLPMNWPASMRSSTTFRTSACASTPTKARWAIFLRPLRRRESHRRARSPQSHRRRVCARADRRCGSRIVRQLLANSRSPRHDRGRTGAACSTASAASAQN